MSLLYRIFIASVYWLHADITEKTFRFTSLCSGIRCIRIRYISIRYIRISCIRVYYNSCLQEMTTLETRRAMSRQIRGLRMHTLGPGFPLISLV